MPGECWPALRRFVFVAGLELIAAIPAAAGQLGALVSPGPLAKAHASLEGVGGCAQCHEAGRRISAARCLSCHKPIADRIAKKVGVHRAVTGDCVACHGEHAGPDAELRRLDLHAFDHAAETGFPLDGQHARLAATCDACHKKRTFVDLRPVCVSCHADVHKGALGTDCVRCHSTATRFKLTRSGFDHSTARFALTGAHRDVACEKCHLEGKFKGLAFDTCAACHREPHRHKLAAACTDCHTTERWNTRTIDHVKTGFTLVGAHAQVACAKCHTNGVKAPLRFDQCSACHVNLHRDSIKDDCRACHTETSFKAGRFDHTARTRFPLIGKHEGLACRKCHVNVADTPAPAARRIVDFGGARTACQACHEDAHKGDYGLQCDSCHRATVTFKVAAYVHPREPAFFTDQHARATCVRCHVNRPAPVAQTAFAKTGPRPAALAFTCDTCHQDVHLGQVGPTCDRCHEVAAPQFKPARFSHVTTTFPLTGRHQTVECVSCHTRENQAFPSGRGTAVKLHPLAADCASCHKDPHFGQVDRRCEICHETSTFRVAAYTHQGLTEFFAGFHGRYPCASCHKKETGTFPAGSGTAIRFRVPKTCVGCHPGF